MDVGLLLPIGFFILLYFVLIRPQNKRRKEQQAMVAGLTVGDEIVTIGGLHGQVLAVTDATMDITVDADGNVVMRFERSALARIVRDDLLDDVNDDDEVDEVDEFIESDPAEDRDA